MVVCGTKSLAFQNTTQLAVNEHKAVGLNLLGPGPEVGYRGSPGAKSVESNQYVGTIMGFNPPHARPSHGATFCASIQDHVIQPAELPMCPEIWQGQSGVVAWLPEV